MLFALNFPVTITAYGSLMTPIDLRMATGLDFGIPVFFCLLTQLSMIAHLQTQLVGALSAGLLAVRNPLRVIWAGCSQGVSAPHCADTL